MDNKKQERKERKERESERQELFQLLQNHSQLRTGQDQVLWSIFGAFWATQGLLLVSIFSASNYQDKVGLVISCIGIIVSIVWVLIQYRALKRMEKYENALKEIEQRLGFTENLNAFYSTKPDSWIKARNVMRFSALLALLLWAVALSIFFCQSWCFHK